MLSMFVCVCVCCFFLLYYLFVHLSFLFCQWTRVVLSDATVYSLRFACRLLRFLRKTTGPARRPNERIMIECKWHDDGQYIEIYGYKLYGYMLMLFFSLSFFFFFFFFGVLSDVSPRCVFLVCECIKCRI